MNEESEERSSYPVFHGLVVTLVLLSFSVFIAYQRHQIIRETEKEALQQELHYAASQFKESLLQKVAAVNAIAINYHRNDWPASFDSISRKLLIHDSAIDFITFAENFRIKYVYPLKGNEEIMGCDLLATPLLRKEVELAVENKKVLFFGPFKPDFGTDIGISCRLPVMEGDSFAGLISITSRMATFYKAIPAFQNNNGKFVFRLAKENPITKQWEYFFPNYSPKPHTEISVHIPEGNWILSAAYDKAYPASNEPFQILLYGIAFSLLGGLFAYKRARLPEKFENTVKAKTRDLNERIKELSTIYKLSQLLKDDTLSQDEAFTRILQILPQGWQYTENCGVKITFDGREYASKNYVDSPFRQTADFELVDGRKGQIEVIYTAEKPAAYEGPFIKEERDLLDSAADTITIYFNKAIQQVALKESEEIFRGAFEDAAIGMAIVSLEGRWMKVNKALCDMVGYTEEEMTQLTFQQITHPDDMGKDEEFLRQMNQYELNYYRAEKRYFHKQGHTVWINLNVAIIRDNAGKPTLFVSQIEDISEKKKITEQLMESEHKLRLFVEHSPAALAMFDMDMNYVITSKRWVTDYKLYGKDLIGKNHYEIFSSVPQSWKDIHSRCLKGASERCEEDSFAGNDGSLVWLSWEIHPWRKASGEVGGIIMFTEVITDRVETRMKFQNLVEQSLVGVYIIQNGKFAYVNPKIVEESGYSEAELLNLPLDQFIYEEDVSLVKSKIQDKLRGVADPAGYEIRARIKSGELLWIEMFGTTTFYQGSKAIIGTMINITERKNMELERQKIINDLVQHNKNLEQFADVLSHNVRSPLSTILGLSHIIQEEQNETEKALIIDGIEHAAKQLDEVLKDLNLILRVRRNLTDMKHTIRLEEVMYEVKQMLHFHINASKAIIEWDFSGAEEIYSVRTYLHSIFYNIISNSIKYAKKDIPPHIFISSEKKGETLCLTFKDNGMGIDMARYGNQLFGLYKRFNMDVEGKGLGLFMTKAQVETLNGHIEVKSAIGEGTCFVISFEG